MSAFFKVAAPSLSVKPPSAFFEAVVEQAALAVNSPRPTEAQAWALCEYLDCVDAGDLPPNRAFRQLCANSLAKFLWDAPPELIARFNRGSFAAAAQGVTVFFNARRAEVPMA